MRNKISAVLGSILFLIIAPGTIAGLVPWWVSRWKMQAPFLGLAFGRMLGVVLIIFGLIILLDSFARFAFQGIGTPAPVFPTRHLVTKGFYRYVRNPIYVAVVAIIAGQALLFANIALIVYAIVIWLGFHIFILIYEEPTLRKTFGTEYDVMCANVPRWLPRRSPWTHERDPQKT
jgi:protein-S-isoprenylcysteine O-methyltransferase Ste14